MITVLRMGHRHGRDDRISTHVGLTARQFGADRIVYTGEEDRQMLDSLQDVVDRWGGPFHVEHSGSWRPLIKEFDGTTVHLTMYGDDYRDHLDAVDAADDLLLVVGAEKVPSAVYDLVDYNLAVGHQPHSEVAALAVLLHDRSGGAELDAEFQNAAIKVVPQERGKQTHDLS